MPSCLYARRGTACRAPTFRIRDLGWVLVGFFGHNLNAGHVHGDTVVVEADILFGDGNVHQTGLSQPLQVDVPVLVPGDAASPVFRVRTRRSFSCQLLLV